MKTRKTSMAWATLTASVPLLALGMSTSVMAQDQTRDKTQDRTRDQVQLQDPIYGSQLMTLQERNEYQTKMRNLKTEQEREAYRLEHHQRMQERAKVKGVMLPETSPPARPAMGPGPGPGSGAGMGAGAGSGMGGGAGGGMGSGAGGGMGGGAGGKK